MKTEVSIDDRLLIDKNLEEEYLGVVNESVDNCHEQLQAGPSTRSRGTRSRGGVLSEDASFQENTSPKVQERDGKHPDQVTRTSKCGPQVPRSAGGKRVQEVP